MLFSEHIPADAQVIPYVRKLVKVYDGLVEYKDESVDQFRYAYNPKLLDNIYFLRKYLYELGQMPYIDGMPRKLYENFIMNASTIYRTKGSETGFLLFLRSITDGDAIVDFSNGYPPLFLQPNDIEYGYLPDGNDLGNAIGNPNGNNNNGIYFLYPFSTFADYYNSFEIRMLSPYFYVQEFRQYIADVVPKFLPMFYDLTGTLTLKFYGHTFSGTPIDSILIHDNL